MLPDFLVIGGMKCGSTTLHDDLAKQPEIALAEKECGVLANPGATPERIRDDYRRQFAGARPKATRGDVSTTYAMLPVISGVAERAAMTLPPTTKIVYLVREPVARAISHHHHMHSLNSAGKMGRDINECLRTRPEIIEFSKYAMQLAPWIEAFSREAIHVIRFEDYIADRVGTLRELLRFLGHDSPEVAPLSASGSNRSSGKPLLGPLWSAVSTSAAYRVTLRRLLPTAARRRIMGALFAKAPAAYGRATAASIEKVRSMTANDTEKLRQLLRCDKPLWPNDARLSHAG